MLSRVCAVAAAAALPSNSSANQILAVLSVEVVFFGVFKMQKQKWDKMSLCLFQGFPPSGMSAAIVLISIISIPMLISILLTPMLVLM